MVIPTLLFMPLGHWLLVELDPLWMKRAMALIIAMPAYSMLTGFRYRHPMTTAWLIVVGSVRGIVFGGTYIALVAVVCILLGPYDKHQGRTLIISWSFLHRTRLCADFCVERHHRRRRCDHRGARSRHLPARHLARFARLSQSQRKTVSPRGNRGTAVPGTASTC